MKLSQTPFGALVKVIHAFMIPIRSLVMSDSSILSMVTPPRKDLMRGETTLLASSVTLPGHHPGRNDYSRQSSR